MKYLNTYNESIRDFLKPKSEENILKSIEHLTPYEKVKKILNQRKYSKDNIISNDELNKILSLMTPVEKLILGCKNELEWLVKQSLEEGVDPTHANNIAIIIAHQKSNWRIMEMLLRDNRVKNLLSEDTLQKYYSFIKLCKDFNQMNNESIKQFLKPKSEESILKSIENLSDGVKFEISCKFGLTSIVKYLIDNGFDPSYGNNYGITIASENGHLDVVKLLLNDKRVDPSEKYNHSIRWTSRNGHLNVVKELLKDERVDPSYVDNYAIMYASHYDHLEIVKELLKDERVISKLSKKYLKKYQKQIEELNESIRDFLKPKSEENILKSLENLSDENKFIKGCEFGMTSIVKDLIYNGFDPSYNHNYGIRIASSNGHIEVVKLLLKDKRVDPSDDHNYAIRLSSKNGHLDMVKLLLNDKRVDPSDWDNYSIRWSTYNDHLEIVKLLLKDKRINPNYFDNSIIRLSSEKGNLDVVKELLKDKRVTNKLPKEDLEKYQKQVEGI